MDLRPQDLGPIGWKQPEHRPVACDMASLSSCSGSRGLMSLVIIGLFISASSLNAQFRWERLRAPLPGFFQIVYHEELRRTFLWSGHQQSPDTISEWDGTQWIPRTAGRDPKMAFYHPSVTYDSARKQIMWFGGGYLNGATAPFSCETWIWDGARWVLHKPQIFPPARHAALAGFDRKRSRVVLYGGIGGSQTQNPTKFDDTWEWDGIIWHTTNPKIRPPSTWTTMAAMDYDPVNEKVALFTDRLWHWDGVDWKEVAGSQGPMLGALASDPDGKKLYLFDNSGAFWEWDGKAWLRIPNQAVWPLDRTGHQMVWDRHRKRLILWGGAKPNTSTQRGGEDSNMFVDLWEWDGQRWEEVLSGGALPGRADTRLAYDSNRRRVVMLVGGFPLYSSNPLWPSMTWEWDGQGWIATRPNNQPVLQTALPSMAYDSDRGRTVIFGGYDWTNYRFSGATWEWDGKDWHLCHPPIIPPYRFRGFAGYYPDRKVVIVLGGEGPGGDFVDHWEWDGNIWVDRKPANLPPFRSRLHYNPYSRKMVLFQSDIPSGPPFRWEWDGINWQKFSTTGFPAGPHTWGHTAYDPTRNLYFVLRYDTVSQPIEVWLSDGQRWWQASVTGDVPFFNFISNNTSYAYDHHRQEFILPGGGLKFNRNTWIMRWDDFQGQPEVPLGGRTSFSLDIPAEAGQIYLSFLSESILPGIPVPGKPDLPIGFGSLFFPSLYLPGHVGLLDNQGKASFGYPIPNDPHLRGLWLHSAALTMNLNGVIRHVTPRHSFYLY